MEEFKAKLLEVEKVKRDLKIGSEKHSPNSPNICQNETQVRYLFNETEFTEIFAFI